MNHLALSFVWCWLQALVVAGLALALAAAALRRSPAAGAAIAWSGVAAVLAMSVLALLPIPTAAIVRRPVPAAATSQAAVAESTRPAAAASDPAALFTLSLERFRIALAPLQQTQSVVARYEITGCVLLGVAAVCVLLSLARVAHGLREIQRLYRQSSAVGDAGVLATIAELQPKIGLSWLPPVRECHTLASAAVVGWWRPVVMLPAEWRDWSPAELQAVLAHELAHVQRRDALVRLVAALTAALYCVQPLVLWLRRQLLLAQELAADELAARAVGGRDAYLHALARLALRQDRRPNVAPAPMLLPVFSGFLLRRIDMLRAKDGSSRRGSAALLQGTAIAAIVAATLTATAIRGLAQPPAAEEPIRVAKANDARPGPADPAQGLFQRPHFDPATVAVRDSAAFILRVGEILRRPDLADQARELDTAFAAGWKEAFAEADLAPWSLREIDYVAGDFHFAVKPMPQPTKDGSNQVVFGSQWWVVKWQKPLDGQFAALQRLPSAEKKSHSGRDLVVLPAIPVLGPGNMCITQLDDRTLLCSQSEKTLIERLTTFAETAPPPSWHKTWDAVEGGLLTVVTTDKHVARPLGAPVDDEAKLLNEIATHVRSYAVGVDWQPQAGGVCVVKLQLGCDSEEDARLVQATVRSILDRQLKELAEADVDDAEAQLAKTYVQWLQKARLETRQASGNWHVAVQIACPLDAAALWKGL